MKIKLLLWIQALKEITIGFLKKYLISLVIFFSSLFSCIHQKHLLQPVKSLPPGICRYSQDRRKGDFP